MTKPNYRKRRLFPRTLDEVVKSATKPILDQQKKFYAVLLRDWAQIVGPEMAAVSRPSDIKFPGGQNTGAILQIDVEPSRAPELHYATTTMLEQLARYFGYKAVERITLNPQHDRFAPTKKTVEPLSAVAAEPVEIPANLPRELQDIFARMQAHFSGDKQDGTR